ncbi:MAG: hypothetical protein JNK76_18505 [Planctomycetales bacterium]|nr:hypothetical protein [Planctomycetales bacterium]MBN8626215.1 hypothetical protein [Planctomycetota bacterium]
MRLLTLCYPTFGKDNALHLNSAGTRIVLAPDQFHVELSERGWQVDVVSLAEPTQLPLFRSGLTMKRIEEVDLNDYDVFWHMFRDPTQPEVLAELERLRLDFGGKPILNDTLRLRQHHKRVYLPVLERYGLAPRIITNVQPTPSWISSHSTFVSPERREISTNVFNNNRGDYPERGTGRIVTEFVDNRVEGLHSIVRIGYALGGGFRGWRYFSPLPAFKSGNAVRSEPYSLPEQFQAAVAAALNELGCDVCHFEAVPLPDRIVIFDVNPYPTADGTTLTPITADLAEQLTRRLTPERNVH